MQFGSFLLLQSPSAQRSENIFSRGVELAQAADELGFTMFGVQNIIFQPMAICRAR